MSSIYDKSFVEMRIKLLTSQQKSNVVKNCSPTLKDLQEKKPSRVESISDIYEKKPWSHWKSGCNWWIDGLHSPQVLTRKDATISGIFRPIPKLDDVAKMEDILKMEKDHIAQINKFLVHIDCTLNDVMGFIAMKLRENKFCLFGNLKIIYRLHKAVVLPQMLKTNGKCIDFVQALISMIDNDHFYCFVSHKMLERSMKRLHDEHLFMLQPKAVSLKPFEILEVYRNWITNVCNELMKYPTQNADDVAVCIEAEKKLNDLIDVIADAESVSHILQVTGTPIDVQFKVYSIIRKYDADIHEPMLLLIPNKNRKYSYRYPINIMQLGKFIKTFQFSMTSHELGYMNDSRFFVFETCIIYTTVVNNGKSFSYENHFWIKDVTFDVQQKKKIIAELKNLNHVVKVDNAEMVAILMEMKSKHHQDEITAEIDMGDNELVRIIDDTKTWRRHSVVTIH